MKELFTYFYKCRMCGKIHPYYGQVAAVDELLNRLELATNPGAMEGEKPPWIPPKTKAHVCVDGERYGVADLIGMIKGGR